TVRCCCFIVYSPCHLSHLRSVPTRSRFRSSRCPGFRRKNVTVRWAVMAAPLTSPVDPSTPLGTSTATTRALPLLSTCATSAAMRSEEHTSELQSREKLVCRLLLEKKNNRKS